MSAMLHPGVYVREAPGGPRSIEGASTSTAIFVGETERGPIGPTKIRGMTEYERLFGGYLRARDGGLAPTRVFMPYALEGFFRNGGTAAYVLRAMDGFGAGATSQTATRNTRSSGDPIHVETASPGIWGNGVLVTYAASTDGDDARFRIVVFYAAPEGATTRLVEDWDRLSVDATDENYVVDVLRRSSYVRWFEATPPERPPLDDDSAGPTEATLRLAGELLGEGTGGGSSLAAAQVDDLLERLAEVDDASLLVAASDRQLPDLDTSDSDDDYVAFGNLFVNYALNRPLQDLFFVGDLPSLAGETTPVTAAANHARGAGVTGSTASNFNALYWPHVEVDDPVGAGSNATLFVPPAGHVAGVYARTDGRRGVWKAPAGVEATLGGVRAVELNVLDGHQDDLNPLGINALRQVPSAGLVVWGTRTRQPSSEWRYVPVRRTAIFMRKSIYDGIQWAVFEPNGEPLWSSLRATVGAFMETQFRNGAFAGATSSEAYFVKCDAETTTDIDQAAGIVNIMVGFAPLRPAEFVVVTLRQKVAQAA